MLRLVHSGFGASDWNDEYDGVRRGWQFELRSLSHYLRHKRGLPRRVAWVRAPIDMPYPEAWDRLWSSEGLLKRGAMPGTNEHDRYSITFGKGDTLEGAVLYSEQPTDFSRYRRKPEQLFVPCRPGSMCRTPRSPVVAFQLGYV